MTMADWVNFLTEAFAARAWEGLHPEKARIVAYRDWDWIYAKSPLSWQESPPLRIQQGKVLEGTEALMGRRLDPGLLEQKELPLEQLFLFSQGA